MDSATPTRMPQADDKGEQQAALRSKDSTSASQSRNDGQFTTGAILAGRYRIVSLLGSGGMGEVYKAEDLKLNQTVALKFLPAQLALDAGMLARFHNEVRIARQVTHPNVCRVYDIGEAEGRHFISMEFIGGEDLSSLLRRIGRLPGDKAVEIARQLCSGLAAAHEQGVLHRDLKPANVMIDGRGKARITDFGLAIVSEEFRGDDVIAGTPAYMSPEQLTGKEVTRRSDIYSLGLVLYELFTGKRAYEARSTNELIELHDKSTPPTPSTHVKDLDPLAERLILRCLERDPNARPASAVQVALALPGGDPLQAALAMGETPSPEVVAASGEKTGLRPAVAMACLAAVVVGLVIAAWLSSKINLIEHALVDNPPDALARKAREISAQLGYIDRPADSVWEFEYNNDYLRYVETNDPSPRRWQHVQPQAVIFRYRESERPFQAGVAGNQTDTVPILQPPRVAQAVDVTLDGQGRLLRFSASPRADQSLAAAPDWIVPFHLAGLDPARFTPAEPGWTPPTPSDAQAAWMGSTADEPNLPVRIEAAAWRGKPVHFEIVYPWTSQPAQTQTETFRFSDLLAWVVLIITLIGALIVARSNQRLGRGDRQGALKLFCVTFSLSLLTTVLTMHYAPAPLQLLNDLLSPLPNWLIRATVVSLYYFAFEPYVRRYWPNSIITWSRVLTGHWRDALVGRDLLIGTMGGICLHVVKALAAYLTGYSYELAPKLSDPSLLPSLLGMRGAGATFFLVLRTAIVSAVYALFILFLVRTLLGRQWLTAGFMILLWLALSPQIAYLPAISVPLMVLYGAVLVILPLRYGLLTLTAALTTSFLLRGFPITTNFSAWYAGIGMVALLAVMALAIFAFYTSLGGQKLFEVRLLEE